MKVAVLGRGKSLLEFANHHTEFEHIYLVNDFNQEIELIGLHNFIGKQVTHVVGRQAVNALSIGLYDALNIDTIQGNCSYMKNFIHEKEFPIKVLPLSKCMDTRGYPTLPWDLIFQHTVGRDKNLLNDYLTRKYPKLIIEAQKKRVPVRIWPTTGILAIDLALTENKLDEIHLFGFDFYADDYLVKKKASYQNSEWVKVKMMKYHLTQLKKEYSDIKFH